MSRVVTIICKTSRKIFLSVTIVVFSMVTFVPFDVSAYVYAERADKSLYFAQDGITRVMNQEMDEEFDEDVPPWTIDELSSAQIEKLTDPARVMSDINQYGTVRLLVKLAAPSDFVGVAGLEGTAEAQEMAKIASVQDKFMLDHPALADDNVTFEYIPWVGVWVESEAEYAELLANENVVLVEQDIPVPASEVDVAPPTMAEAVPWVSANTAHNQGYNGSGYTIAILDSGVDKGHNYLSGKVVSEACYSTYSDFGSWSICPGGWDSTASGSAMPYGGSCPSGECDHGTHVAGIAAGNYGSFKGIAPDANIIAIQVFSGFPASFPECNGSPCTLTYTIDQILGLERVYALRNTYNIAAVNMSLGGGQYSSYCDTDSRKMIIDMLKSAGIATVISAGNEWWTSYVGTPGCISTAYTTGATFDNSDSVAWFSNAHSTILDMWAPGVSITSSVPGSANATDTWNGTSMAAPMVAGAFAVMRQAYPGYTVDQIWNKLSSAGVSVTDNRSGGTTTAPRLDFQNAFTGIELVSPFGDVPTDHELYAHIRALYDAGYTSGCSTYPLMYCPDTIMTRSMGAVFMLRGQFGSGYTTAPATGTLFADMTNTGAWDTPWAEAMYNEGLSAGCGTDPLRYCPVSEMTRQEASVFGLRLKYGMSYSPPPATGTLLADMTNTGSWATPWCEQAYLDGLLPECGWEGDKPLFCPEDLVDRGWGAYLVVEAKGLLD